MRSALLLGLVVLCAPAAAQMTYSSDEGHQYNMQCTRDGHEFTSHYPVSRQVGAGANRQNVVGIEKVYLGRSCDAYHPIFGEGTWCWANGGFWASFPGQAIGFGGSELYCPDGQEWPDTPPGTEGCRC